jgi:hypothetical protein
MYVDSSPVPARRSAGTAPRRKGRRQRVSAAARRTRLADAIVSQWLLEQVPADHRHALRTASELRRELPV